MSDESDGVNEAVSAALRVALTAAGRVAEAFARERQQAAQQAQARSQQEARELQARLDAERSAARASLAPLDRSDWWDRARTDDIAVAWETANAWSDVDPDAAAAVDRMRDELRSRYDLDVEDLGADAAAVRAAVERRELALQESAAERQRAREEEGEAAALLAGDDRLESGYPSLAAGSDKDAAELYDSAGRREALASQLEGVDDEEAVEARLVADVGQARPPEEAVTKAGPRAAKAKRGRGNAGRVPERGVQR